jgi:hypothetical protein
MTIKDDILIFLFGVLIVVVLSLAARAARGQETPPPTMSHKDPFPSFLTTTTTMPKSAEVLPRTE